MSFLFDIQGLSLFLIFRKSSLEIWDMRTARKDFFLKIGLWVPCPPPLPWTHFKVWRLCKMTSLAPHPVHSMCSSSSIYYLALSTRLSVSLFERSKCCKACSSHFFWICQLQRHTKPSPERSDIICYCCYL